MRWTTWGILPLTAALAATPKFSEESAQQLAHESVIYLSDQDVVMYSEAEETVLHSSDGGRSWAPSGLSQVSQILSSKGDQRTAFAVTDNGIASFSPVKKSWQAIDLSSFEIGRDELAQAAVEIGKGQTDSVVFNFINKPSIMCQSSGCETLVADSYCIPHTASQAALCLTRDGALKHNNQHTDWVDVAIDGMQNVTVTRIDTSNNFFVALFSKSDGSSGLAVTKDLSTWKTAKFGSFSSIPPESTVNIVEVPGDSIVLAIGNSETLTRDLWTSNAAGDVFTLQLEHIREQDGTLDFEVAQFAPGSMFANVFMDHYHKHHNMVARMVSRVSLNSGRTWIAPQVIMPNGEKHDFHFHLTVNSVLGSTPIQSVPGLLAAYGNTGGHMHALEDATLHISRDNGATWTPTQFTSKEGFFGLAANGALFLQVSHSGLTYKVSRDQGLTVQQGNLPNKSKKVRAVYAAENVPEVIIVDRHGSAVHEDLSTLLKVCSENEMEQVQSDCQMGARYTYMAPKPNSQCYVPKTLWQEAATCGCSISDYECDVEFVRNDDGVCSPDAVLALKLKTCQPGTSQHLSTGYQRIPGNKCDNGNGEKLDGVKNYECGSKEFKASGQVQSQSYELSGNLENYMYLKTGDNREEETVLAWTTSGQLVISHDQGSAWQEFPHGAIEKVWSNSFFNDHLLIYTRKRELYGSADRGVTFKKISLPGPLNLFGTTFGFHSTERDWMIVTIIPENCESADSCLPSVYATLNFGGNWQKLGDDMASCTFVGNLQYETEKTLVFCEKREGNTFDLVSSTDWFKSSTVNVKDTYGFAVDDSFLVTVSADADNKVIRPQVSIDGRTFSTARIPSDITLDKTTGYTVIDTFTKSVFLGVTTNLKRGQEMATLLKSNFLGTEYVAALPNINRDMLGLIDFEKIRSTEGVALANVVANADDMRQRGERKILKSMISHSDGAAWDYITPPEGECRGKTRVDCSLHIHGFTERIDMRNKPYSQSAVGLIIGNGNTGDALLPLHDAATYLSRDGGFSFSKVSDHPSFWEYGDSGSVIVLVPRGEPTNKLRYTLNEGKDWIEYQFSDPLVSVLNVANIPSDTSRKFLLFVQPPKNEGQNTRIIQVDFRQLAERQCVYEGPKAENDDFELWVPSHPQRKDDCLFGHVSMYYRKIPDRNCYVGKVGKKLGEPKRIVKNCECTREDYECDFNYALASDGTCKLVDSNLAMDMDAQCSVPGAIAWHKVTGYRRIPIDTCVSGQKLDDGNGDRPCPGKEVEFEERYGRRPGTSPVDGGEPGNSGEGPSAFRIFISVVFAVFIVGTLAVVLMYKFRNQGRIYLGEVDEPANALDKLAVTALAVAANAGQQLLRVWDAFVGNLDSRFRSSHINLYERIDNEERTRILDSDLEDDLDNPELGEDLDLDMNSD